MKSDLPLIFCWSFKKIFLKFTMRIWSTGDPIQQGKLSIWKQRKDFEGGLLLLRKEHHKYCQKAESSLISRNECFFCKNQYWWTFFDCFFHFWEKFCFIHRLNSSPFSCLLLHWLFEPVLAGFGPDTCNSRLELLAYWKNAVWEFLRLDRSFEQFVPFHHFLINLGFGFQRNFVQKSQMNSFLHWELLFLHIWWS